MLKSHVAALAVLLPGLFSQAQTQPAAKAPKVVIISLDAFGAETLKDPYTATPELHRMMAAGAFASMKPINPTVTWPNHTAIITGQDASHHHVVVNGLITGQRTDHPMKMEPWAPKAKMVAVPTLYDVAHKAGLKTAEIDWVAITDPGTIDFSFPELPKPDGPIEQELITAGKTTREDLMQFTKHPGAWRDRIYTNAAVDILRKHHPDLLLMHLLSFDAMQHASGFGSEGDYNTLAFLDDRVAQVVEAVRENGDIENTTFLIVSDHGQESVHFQIHPDVLLKEAGYQSPSSPTPTYCIPEGGVAIIYQKNATPASIAELMKLFTGKTGIRSVLTSDEAAAMGWPKPSQTDQGPDLVLYPENDYAFAGGPSVTSLITQGPERGSHGFPNSEPLMQASFIASGADIRKAGRIEPILNLDVAPTVAKILHLNLPNVQGRVLTEVLK